MTHQPIAPHPPTAGPPLVSSVRRLVRPSRARRGGETSTGAGPLVPRHSNQPRRPRFDGSIDIESEL